MLDRISREQGRTPTVETLFQGTTRTVTVCNACQHHSKTEETPFRSLDVSVQTHSSVAAAFREAYGTPSGILDDYRCEKSATEQMQANRYVRAKCSTDDAVDFRGSRCGDRWSSTSGRIARAPQILCIQLQRFKSRGEGKCEDHIKVDQFLHIDVGHLLTGAQRLMSIIYCADENWTRTGRKHARGLPPIWTHVPQRNFTIRSLRSSGLRAGWCLVSLRRRGGDTDLPVRRHIRA